jgi:hypothetical protein
MVISLSVVRISGGVAAAPQPQGDVISRDVTEQQDGPVVLSFTMILHTFLLVAFFKERPEHIFYHAVQVLGFHQRKAAYFSAPAPADQGEFVPGFDPGFLPDILGEHHLSTVIHGKDCFDFTS